MTTRLSKNAWTQMRRQANRLPIMQRQQGLQDLLAAWASKNKVDLQTAKQQARALGGGVQGPKMLVKDFRAIVDGRTSLRAWAERENVPLSLAIRLRARHFKKGGGPVRRRKRAGKVKTAVNSELLDVPLAQRLPRKKKQKKMKKSKSNGTASQPKLGRFGYKLDDFFAEDGIDEYRRAQTEGLHDITGALEVGMTNQKTVPKVFLKPGESNALPTSFASSSSQQPLVTTARDDDLLDPCEQASLAVQRAQDAGCSMDRVLAMLQGAAPQRAMSSTSTSSTTPHSQGTAVSKPVARRRITPTPVPAPRRRITPTPV